MPDKPESCNQCGGQVLKGDIGLRTGKDLEPIMVVRRDHGVEKKIPLQPKICGKCGFVSFYLSDPACLKITSTDKPVDPNFQARPLCESDF